MTYPDKPANNQYPIAEIIKNRWSPRLFADSLVEVEKVMSLFEAARWTQSSRNEQPWRFVYAAKDDPENFNRLSGFLNQGNAWANQASLLIVIFTKRIFDFDGKSNYNAMYDTGAAANNLFLEAVHQGLVAHEMIGFNKERAEKELGAPDNFKVAVMMAVGYPAGLSHLKKMDAAFQERELAKRQRLSIEEIVFKGKFNVY